MYRRKSFISLSLSLVLAAGTLTAPVLAADEFTDGMGVETFSNTDQIPSAENGTEQETSSAKNQGKSNADADFNATVFTDGGENKAISVVTLLNSIVQMMISQTAMLQIAALLMIPQQEMILQLQKEQYKNSRMVLFM